LNKKFFLSSGELYLLPFPFLKERTKLNSQSSFSRFRVSLILTVDFQKTWTKNKTTFIDGSCFFDNKING
jgi:hypothetical protein